MERNVRQAGDEQIALAIRKRRAELEWSQEELAKRSGLKQTTVSGYENGTRTPGPNALRALSRTMRVPINYFYGDQATRDLMREALGGQLDDMDDETRKLVEESAVSYIRLIAAQMVGRRPSDGSSD